MSAVLDMNKSDYYEEESVVISSSNNNKSGGEHNAPNCSSSMSEDEAPEASMSPVLETPPGANATSPRNNITPNGRLTGFGKSFRRITFGAGKVMGSISSNNSTPRPAPTSAAPAVETVMEPSNTETKEADENLGPLPSDKEEQEVPARKKTSALEEENLSKILHRRSRPRSSKYAPFKLPEHITSSTTTTNTSSPHHHQTSE